MRLRSAVIALIIVSFLFICPSAKGGQSIAIVKGKLNEYRLGKLILWKVVEGNKTEVASFQNDQSKAFVFAVPVTGEGLYYLTDQTRWWQVRMYLKPGDQLELAINYSGHYDVVKGSMENKLLREWHQFAAGVLIPSGKLTDTTGYESYFGSVNKFLTIKDNFKKRINTPSKKFNGLMNLIVDVETEHAALRYCFTPLRKLKDTSSGEMMITFLRQFIQPAKYCDARILSLGEGIDLLSLYANACYFTAESEKRKAFAGRLERYCDLFCNDTLKGAFLVNRLPRYKFYDELVNSMEPVRKFFVTEGQQKAFSEKLNSMDSMLVKGRPGYNFSIADKNGNNVSMSAWKGKLVLIDLWATWCKPCIEEIPALKKLADEYKEKDIEFVSISFDEGKDKEKWEKFLEKEKLGGVQLFAGGFENKVSSYYKINSIPRFMLFDRNGKIINVDAPRPSDPTLKQLIENHLSNPN